MVNSLRADREKSMDSPHILVIEDDPGSLKLYDRVLNRAEYKVFKATTLDEAYALINEHHFDLILCDMELGKERTLGLLNEITTNFQKSGTNIVAVSANEQYRQVCEQIGVEFFMSKPVSVRALVTLADRITVGKFDRKIPLVLDTSEMMRAALD
jgi:CheY-like chemotaxis protein